jgi:hypothetical protein
MGKGNVINRKSRKCLCRRDIRRLDKAEEEAYIEELAQVSNVQEARVKKVKSLRPYKLGVRYKYPPHWV